MKISEALRNRVKGYEGYLTKLPDGGCTAYLCPAGVPTIGWGCTEGVHLGMVWTRQEAEDGLTRELAKFEAGVEQRVTVPLNQNEFDACVSLAYNIGFGGVDKRGKKIPGFGNSTLLKRLNNGDRAGAARSFASWNRGGGRVLKGLVSRRASEAALFLKPVEAPEEPFMPQAVEASKEPMGAGKAATIATSVAAPVAGALVTAASSPVPEPTSWAPVTPPPQIIVDSVTNAGIWKGTAETVISFGSFAQAQPYLVGAIVVTVLVLVLGPWAARKLGWDV